jgi:dimethylamine monooxygenase subunit A
MARPSMGASPPRHFPFQAGHDPLRMGVAAIDPRQWFELGDDYAAQMAEKERLLATKRAEVFAILPQADAPARELLSAVARWCVETHPAAFARDGEALRCPDGRRLPLAEKHPLEAAALLVQEDLCILQPDAAGTLVLTGACLCFPSRWRLADKLGHPMLAIHGPVPGLNARIGATIDRFLAGLKAGNIYSRTNWSITTDPELFQPVALPHDPVTAREAGDRVFYRVERQTLRSLPETGAVLFGIRIHQHKLAAFAAIPEQRRALAAAVAALDDSLVEYKSMTAIKDAVVEYLNTPASS